MSDTVVPPAADPAAIPQAVKDAETKLQASYNDALAKSHDAQLGEASAQQARSDAEGKKSLAVSANQTLSQNLGAYKQLLDTLYAAPSVPAPSVPQASPLA